jgi:hypothetical protein
VQVSAESAMLSSPAPGAACQTSQSEAGDRHRQGAEVFASASHRLADTRESDTVLRFW